MIQQQTTENDQTNLFLVWRIEAMKHRETQAHLYREAIFQRHTVQ